MNFLVFGFLLFCVAAVCSAALYVRAKRTCPGVDANARQFRAESAAAPFVGLLWIVVALILHTLISNRLAHQSVGFSPDPYVTLPNGYVVGSLNTYDGYVHAPGFSLDFPWVGPGYVRGLIDLTFDDGRFEGTYFDSHSDMQPQGTGHIRHFVFDTHDRSISTSDTGGVTDFGGQQTLVHEHETSYWQIYARYRHGWPTTVFWLILIGGEAAVVVVFRRMKARVHCDES